MSQEEPIDRPANIGRLLLKVMGRVPDDGVAILRELASEGDIDLLKEIFDSRVLLEFADNKKVVTAVRPLEASNIPRGQAKAFVAAWVRSFGSSSSEDLNQRLANAEDVETALDLVAIGADPNGWVDGDEEVEHSAIGHMLIEGRVDVCFAIVDSLLEQQEIPLATRPAPGTRTPSVLRNLFDYLVSRCNQGASEAEEALIEHLGHIPLTAEWRSAIGNALLGYLEQRRFSVQRRAIDLLCQMIGVATFPSLEQWQQVLLGTDNPMAIFHTLTQHAGLRETAQGVIRRFVDDGFAIDDLATSRTHDGADYTYTWLQFAAHSERPDLVQMLIDAGANPNARLGDNGRPVIERFRGMRALEIAQTRDHVEVIALLDKWHAEQPQ